ncbi:hypothetical protein ACP6C7_13600 [Mycolicibacterium septicum]|uniref:Uncharacterized protein n=1 Tax=Mycolicibacterium septicum TaxID=98668 RepID=A0ABW9LUX8_9MYCO
MLVVVCGASVVFDEVNALLVVFEEVDALLFVDEAVSPALSESLVP